MIISCGECGKDVSDKATACPHCGAPPTARPAQAANRSTAGGRGFSIPWRWIFPLAAAAITFATKPDVDLLKDKIYNEALAMVQDQQITEDDNILSGFIKIGCALDARACAEEITARAVIRDRDLVFFRSATITIEGSEISCWGALGDWRCDNSEK